MDVITSTTQFYITAKSFPRKDRPPLTTVQQPDSSCNAHRGGHAALYKILSVKLKNRNKEISTYAYMDDDSGLTLMESNLADELGLQGTSENLCLRWTSGTVRHEKDSMRVVIDISGDGDNQHKYRMRDA